MKDVIGSFTTHYIDGSKTITKFTESVFLDEKNKYSISVNTVKSNLIRTARSIAGPNYERCEIQFFD